MIFLEVNLSTLFESVSQAAIVTPIVQLIIGGLANVFKRWFIDKQDFNRRATFRMEKLTEELTDQLTMIFDRAINSSIPLRGQPPQYPDIMHNYHRSLILHNKRITELRIINLKYRFLDRLLLITTILGLILLILNCLKGLSPYIFTISILFIILQIIVIIAMYKNVEKLETYEQNPN